MYIVKLANIGTKYNNEYSTIKVKPVDVKSGIFVKGYILNFCERNLSEEIFAIKKVKDTAPWVYVISDLSSEEIVESFYEKELKNKNQQ